MLGQAQQSLIEGAAAFPGDDHADVEVVEGARVAAERFRELPPLADLAGEVADDLLQRRGPRLFGDQGQRAQDGNAGLDQAGELPGEPIHLASLQTQEARPALAGTAGLGSGDGLDTDRGRGPGFDRDRRQAEVDQPVHRRITGGGLEVAADRLGRALLGLVGKCRHSWETATGISPGKIARVRAILLTS